MQKLLAIVLTLAMLGSLCATAAAEDKVTIGWTSWALAEEKLIPVYGGSADAFMADNPDITIDYSQSNPYASYLDQLLTAASAGNAPYVAHIKAEWLPQFLELGVLKDIRPYLSDDVVSDYSAAAIAGATVDGQLVAMPWFGNTYALYYNKALLAQAGIDALPQTWAELIEDAYKVSALGDDIYGLAIPNSNGVEAGEGYNVFPALWAHGGEYQDADGKISLANEAGIATFTELQKLIVDKVSPTVGNSFKDLRNLFGQGKIGFYWDLEATIPTAAAAAADQDQFYKDFGCMVIPGADTANGSGYIITHYLVVFNNCPDEIMPQVARFLEYMSGPKVIQIFKDGKQGKMSSRASVMAEVFQDVSETTAVYVQAMETARPLPVAGLHFMDADKEIVKALTRLAQGEDVTAVMTDCQTTIQEMYDEE
ncbi:MAG: sugar ABC transporter substrate-binding protein [Clostridiales bacterium]|nr:sugar ABC transporter substrate-binding protein [Clostridiales bacterium]